MKNKTSKKHSPTCLNCFLHWCICSWLGCNCRLRECWLAS